MTTRRIGRTEDEEGLWWWWAQWGTARSLWGGGDVYNTSPENHKLTGQSYVRSTPPPSRKQQQQLLKAESMTEKLSILLLEATANGQKPQKLASSGDKCLKSRWLHLAGGSCCAQGLWAEIEAVSVLKCPLKVFMIYEHFMNIWALVCLLRQMGLIYVLHDCTPEFQA